VTAALATTYNDDLSIAEIHIILCGKAELTAPLQRIVGDVAVGFNKMPCGEKRMEILHRQLGKLKIGH
jgi:hypothetical protein